MSPVRTLLASLALGSALVVAGCGETTVNRTDPNARKRSSDRERTTPAGPVNTR